jgi:hypothetical protein
VSEKRLIPYGYFPTASRSGNNRPTIFRGENGFVRGFGDNVYFEAYAGSLSLDEDFAGVPLSGTISFSPASRTITGVSTEFQNELHLGQKLMTVLGEVISVEQVLSPTSFIAHELPLTTASGVNAYRLPVLFEIDYMRGVLLSGNALQFDTGTIMAVGSGILYLNGAVLNSSLSASKQAKIAVYNATANTYTIQTLGFDTVPVGVTATATAPPTAKTFVDADVNTTSNTATITAHGWNNGQKVNLTSSGVLPTTNPAGQLAGKDVYVIKIDANTVKFASTLANTVGTPVPIDIATAAGGGTHTVTPVSKAMPAGDRSLLIAKASDSLGVPSFGNPSERIEVTLTAGQGIAVAFTAMDSNSDPTDPHNAWRIYGTRHGGTSTIAAANADSGAWYYVKTVTAAELGTTGAATYYLEYLDAEIDAEARLATFDNDVPPRAEFIGALGGAPVLVSCQGKGTEDYPNGDAPGSSLVPFKLSNLASAPLVFDTGERNEVPLSPPETIIGFYMAAGRLYLLTTNTLQIAAYTENPLFPISTRPFWKSGFKNPYALCFANDRLYGFTNSPIRSPEDGSDANIDRAFAAPVKELTYDWHASRVFVAHDPANECVCYVYSGAYKNEDGFWVSIILPFMLELEQWSPPIILSSDEHDMVVSGVATVAGHFEFLAGGRDGVGGIETNTYRFDSGLNAGETQSSYVAFQMSDGGAEQRPKKIKHPRLTGRFVDSTLGIHGARAGEEIDVDVLEAGNSGSATGSIAIDDSANVGLTSRLEVEANQLSVYTFRVDWNDWDGSGEKPRLDELSYQEIIQGGRK